MLADEELRAGRTLANGGVGISSSFKFYRHEFPKFCLFWGNGVFFRFILYNRRGRRDIATMKSYYPLHFADLRREVGVAEEFVVRPSSMARSCPRSPLNSSIMI